MQPNLSPSGQKPYSVYRIYDESGVLIYVGITARGHQRQAEHLNGQPWAWEVAETHWEHFGSRALAEAREQSLIKSEHPKHNVVHSRPGEPSRMEYRLRAEQYDLLKRNQDLMVRTRAEFNQVVKNFEPRLEAIEKVNRHLLRSIKNGTPLDEPHLNKIRKFLNRSEMLMKHRREQVKKGGAA